MSLRLQENLYAWALFRLQWCPNHHLPVSFEPDFGSSLKMRNQKQKFDPELIIDIKPDGSFKWYRILDLDTTGGIDGQTFEEGTDEGDCPPRPALAPQHTT